MVVTGAGQQRSKAELTADIRARRRTALVVNVRSRRGRRHYPTVCRQLHHAGLDLLTLRPVADPGGLPQALAAAVDSGADLIVVGGGDGTLSEAAHQLAHRDLCLGVLPLGTTNNFARSLGLPLHLPAALHILTEGKVADVDLGHVAGRHFANLTSLGLSVQVAQHVPHQLKRILGRAAYPLTALALLPHHRPFTARLRLIDVGGDAGDDWDDGPTVDHGIDGTTADDGIDGRDRGVHELVTHQLNIANGSHHAGRAIARDTGLDDRQLVIYQLGDAHRLRLTLATVRQTVTGPRRPLAHTPFLTARHVWLHTDPPLDLDVDGEIRGRTPAQITLEANALRVMVAADFPDV
jgi:diacylglycerol kinase (ATP)